MQTQTDLLESLDLSIRSALVVILGSTAILSCILCTFAYGIHHWFIKL